MITRIARVPISSRFAEVFVTKSKRGVKIMIGPTHLNLTRPAALALADALVDYAERGPQCSPDNS